MEENVFALSKGEDSKVKKIILPGRPNSSELVKRLLSNDPDYQMPPPDSHLALSDDEKSDSNKVDRAKVLSIKRIGVLPSP